MRFAAVEFPEDLNVSGRIYWYLCEIERVKEGSFVLAPLGSHNRLQRGVVRQVRDCPPDCAPFPIEQIKRIIQKV